MANGAAIGIGIFFLIIAGVGFVYPVSDGYTIVQVDDICKSGLGQLGQLFSASGQQGCQQVKLMSYGVYGSGLIGIILLITGSVSSRGQKEIHYEREIPDDAFVCGYCGIKQAQPTPPPTPKPTAKPPAPTTTTSKSCSINS